MNKTILVSVMALFILMGFAVPLNAQVEHAPGAKQVNSMQLQVEGGSFDVSEFTLVPDLLKGWIKVTGNVKNNTDKDWSFAKFEVKIFDREGNILESEALMVVGIQQGASKAISGELWRGDWRRDRSRVFSVDVQFVGGRPVATSPMTISPTESIAPVTTAASMEAQVNNKSSSFRSANLVSKSIKSEASIDKCAKLQSAKKRLVCYDMQAVSNTSNAHTEDITQSSSGTKQLKGSIRGSVIYFFNRNIGNKPDSGAKIYLIQGRGVEISTTEILMDMSSLGRDELIVSEPHVEGRHMKIFKKTIADGNGNYELRDIPIGDYTLIMHSSHANGQGQRDVSGKVHVSLVSVTDESQLDESIDFGISYY